MDESESIALVAAGAAALDASQELWYQSHARPDRRRPRLAPLAPEERLAPGYVLACKASAWSLALWRRDRQPLDEAGTWWKICPYKCRSWRCLGACGHARAQADIARIRTGMMVLPEHWSYVVLTFNPADYHGDFTAAYRDIVRCWARLRKRMTRRYGPMAYIITVERHQSGWPHLNILIRNEAFGAMTAGAGWQQVRRDWLGPAALACGFGLRTWLEPVRSVAGISVYLAKLAGEIGKKSQVPLEAPPHFRRLRGSRGVLPPLRGEPGPLTGNLIQSPAEYLDATGHNPLPAFRGQPVEVDLAEPGGDAEYAWVDEHEVEPGVYVIAMPHTRRELWVSYRVGTSQPATGPPDLDWS